MDEALGGADRLGEPEPRSGREADGSLRKALVVLDKIADADAPPRFVDLKASTGFSKATLHRVLKMLLEEGAVALDAETRGYTISLRVMRFAHAAWRMSTLGGIARPQLDLLSARTGQTLHLAVLDNSQVLYLDKRSATRTVFMYSSAGKVGPAYCTGVGKAMLAQLSPERLDVAISQQAFTRHTETTICTPQALRQDLAQIRARGYAIDDQEHEPGIICIAMPILSATGEMFGALSVTGSTHYIDFETLVGFLGDLRSACAEIGRRAEVYRLATL